MRRTADRVDATGPDNDNGHRPRRPGRPGVPTLCSGSQGCPGTARSAGRV